MLPSTAVRRRGGAPAVTSCRSPHRHALPPPLLGWPTAETSWISAGRGRTLYDKRDPSLTILIVQKNDHGASTMRTWARELDTSQNDFLPDRLFFLKGTLYSINDQLPGVSPETSVVTNSGGRSSHMLFSPSPKFMPEAAKQSATELQDRGQREILQQVKLECIFSLISLSITPISDL
jgi:hypothetical protein